MSTAKAVEGQGAGALLMSDPHGDLQAHFTMGYALCEEGDHVESLQHLTYEVEEGAGFVSEEVGPAAYWYGRALKATDFEGESSTDGELIMRNLAELDGGSGDSTLRGVGPVSGEEVVWSISLEIVSPEQYLLLSGALFLR